MPRRLGAWRRCARVSAPRFHARFAPGSIFPPTFDFAPHPTHHPYHRFPLVVRGSWTPRPSCQFPLALGVTWTTSPTIFVRAPRRSSFSTRTDLLWQHHSPSTPSLFKNQPLINSLGLGPPFIHAFQHLAPFRQKSAARFDIPTPAPYQHPIHSTTAPEVLEGTLVVPFQSSPTLKLAVSPETGPHTLLTQSDPTSTLTNHFIPFHYPTRSLLPPMSPLSNPPTHPTHPLSNWQTTRRLSSSNTALSRPIRMQTPR